MNKRQRKKQGVVRRKNYIKMMRRAMPGVCMTRLRKRFCTRHGWAPALWGVCLRCAPLKILTRTAQIQGYLRGWKHRNRFRKVKYFVELWQERLDIK